MKKGTAHLLVEFSMDTLDSSSGYSEPGLRVSSLFQQNAD
jgi:hypothetical protein